MNDDQAASPRLLELCRRFLKSFGQTVKLVSLYSAGHPVPASSQRESWQLLHELFTESGWDEISFSLVAGRWLANGQLVADSAQAYELLAIAFRCHALQSVTFLPDCKLYELSALCELASTPANRAYETDASDFLKERGVRHIEANLESFVRARRVRPLASTAVQSQRATLLKPPVPVAQTSAPAAPRQPPQQSPQRPQAPTQVSVGFGSFIKSIVERAVVDPQERARIYAEAVRHIETALAQHVSQATHKLLLEKQGVVNERLRTENVLATVTEGKMVVDQEGRILMMDQAAEDLIGRPFSDVAGKNILEKLHGDDQFVALAKDLVIPENRPISDEVRTSGGVQTLSAFRQSMALVHDEQGRVVGTYAVLPHAAKYRETQRMQEEFLANITHDLKAPLTSICSALEVLSEKLGAHIDNEEGEFLDICVRNSRTLRQMIDELLDFSKLQSGRMSVRPERQPLEPLLRECVRALLPWARSKKIDLRLDGAESMAELPQVLADRGRVLQILNNLVSNAIKFTPEGGRVCLSAERGQRDNDAVVVRVKDTGCGISPSDQKLIFDRFSQVQSERRGGVGLGLAIARELVLQHRGRVWVDSEEGHGSTFSFTLPVAADDKAGDDAAQ
ncbi:MAG: PAS domain-containing protein [Elusimicrobia bacterium]|nr:PAS domain-containing protein [Elusimicrobiota bacterium]MDE2236740.1 PAS domain-containing protein [Elusimicrobiota bacterium]MDE2424635.1 PAS domain-containing protein [Elusimicrobiota bacterium]